MDSFAVLRGGAPETLLALARDFTPRLERYDAEVVLDVSGLGRLLGDPGAIGAELARNARERVRGRDIRVAVAPTQTAARLLAAACPGPTVVTHGIETALAPLPLDILGQLTAAGGRPVVFETFRRWGLATLGDLAALPAADLSARLGREGVALQRLARGIDSRPLVPDPGVPRFIGTIELEWPIDALEPLSFVLARLLEPLSASLARADRAAVALHLDLRLVDRSAHVRRLQLPAPIRDPRVLRTLLLLDLESHPPAAGIDAVTLEIDPAPGRIVQFSLLERAVPSPETLATLTARLRALVGEDRCGAPALVDTHRPGAFELRPFAAVAERAPAAIVRHLPGERSGQDACLRRFRPPVAVRVELAGGRPARVAIDRRGMPGGRVERWAGPWRTSGSWWEAGRWDRDEWDAALSDGSLCRLFRDRVSGTWFLDGVLD